MEGVGYRYDTDLLFCFQYEIGNRCFVAAFRHCHANRLFVTIKLTLRGGDNQIDTNWIVLRKSDLGDKFYMG